MNQTVLWIIIGLIVVIVLIALIAALAANARKKRLERERIQEQHNRQHAAELRAENERADLDVRQRELDVEQQRLELDRKRQEVERADQELGAHEKNIRHDRERIHAREAEANRIDPDFDEKKPGATHGNPSHTEVHSPREYNNHLGEDEEANNYDRLQGQRPNDGDFRENTPRQ